MNQYTNTLYEELKIRKQNGENLNLSELTMVNFIQLWYKEHNSLYQIGTLFGVSEYTVKKLKNNWGLTLRKLLMRELSGELAIEYAFIKNIDRSQAIKEIERAKHKVELLVGKQYDNPLDCFGENEPLIWHNLQYHDIVEAFKQLVASKEFD